MDSPFLFPFSMYRARTKTFLDRRLKFRIKCRASRICINICWEIYWNKTGL